MKKTLTRRLPLQPLANGQVWRMAEAILQVTMVGKLLVHYKLGKPQAIRVSHSVNSIILIVIVLYNLMVGETCSGAILFPKDPYGGREAVLNRIKFTLESHPEFLKNIQMSRLMVTNSFRSYTCNLQDMSSGKFLSVEKFISWNYFIVSSNEAVAQATFEYNGNKPKYLELSSAPVGAFIGLQSALNLPQTSMQDYEFRLIRIPPIPFSAIWLHGRTNDIIMPLPPCYGRMREYCPYTENEVMKVLEPEAKEKLKKSVEIPD